MRISTSASSFDFNKNEATAGCLSGLLHRLLCRNFHPSPAQEFVVADPKQEQIKPPPSPNLVARLMGLDTMPIHPDAPSQTISRSRSANSAEGWNGFLSGNKNWIRKHRTSQSFREEPTFLRKENDEFLVLTFSPDDDDEENPVVDSGEREARINNSSTPKPRSKKEAHRKSRRGANRDNFSDTKMMRASTESDQPSSQDSSPVSVLDRHLEVDSDCQMGPDSPISGMAPPMLATNADDEKRRERAKQRRRRRRKLSSSELKIESYPSNKLGEGSKSNANNGDSGSGSSSRGKSSSERRDRRREGLDSWAQICQLAAEDVKRSCWDLEEHSEEIAVVIGLQILDLIVNEVLTEFYI